MALAVHVAGPCLIRTDVSGTLQSLGYSVNGVDIETVEFRENVAGDENGGDAGPPIEVLKHGDLHIVSIEMSKWEDALVRQLETRVKNGTAGSVTSGILYHANSRFVRLLLTAPNFTRNYLAAIPIGPCHRGQIGSRYSRTRLQFECHAVGGVLYNTVTS